MSWSTSELRLRLAPLNWFKPSIKIFYWPFQGRTSFVYLQVFFFCLVFAMSLCASVYMCFVVTCWERADLLTLVCGVWLWVCHFPIGILGRVRCATWLYRFLIYAPLLTLWSVCWMQSHPKMWIILQITACRTDLSHKLTHSCTHLLVLTLRAGCLVYSERKSFPFNFKCSAILRLQIFSTVCCKLQVLANLILHLLIHVIWYCNIKSNLICNKNHCFSKLIWWEKIIIY